MHGHSHQVDSSVGVLIVVGVRLYREGLTDLLNDQAGIYIKGAAADHETAIALAQAVQPDVTLLDTTLPDSLAGVEMLVRVAPNTRIIALAVTETESEIVSFAELEKFIDTPVKYYSSGMYVRLAFAVAAHLEPEILLVDEVLAVGDLEFQKKCLGRMSEVSKAGRTIVFISHQMGQIRRLCERVIWVDHGVIKKDGPTLDVVSAYEGSFTERIDIGDVQDKISGRDIQFLKWELLVDNGAPSNVLQHFGPVSFRVVIHLPETIRKGNYAILLLDDDGRIIWHGNCEFSALEPGTFEFMHRLPTLPIKPGAYRWKIGIYDGRKWTDPWWALPELFVGTKPLLTTADEFMPILNLPCDMEVRPLEELRK